MTLRLQQMLLSSVIKPQSLIVQEELLHIKSSFGRDCSRFHQVKNQRIPQRKRVSMSVSCQSNTTNVQPATSQWFQKTIQLPGFKRGCHIITSHIVKSVPEISQFKVGIAHIFVMHTSASLTINENASPDVPLDMEDTLNKIVPEGKFYRHLDEGYDDMPAHVKSSLMGCSLTIPISHGKLNLGTWQGIWLNEHRDYGGPRKVCITIQGERREERK